MSAETERLRDLFMEVTDEETLVDRQETDVSHDPVGADEAELEETMSALVREDGLGDAIDGAETGGSSDPATAD